MNAWPVEVAQRGTETHRDVCNGTVKNTSGISAMKVVVSMSQLWQAGEGKSTLRLQRRGAQVESNT